MAGALTLEELLGQDGLVSRDPFVEDATRLGELFAGPAAVAVRNAQVLERAQAQVVNFKPRSSTAPSSIRPLASGAAGTAAGRT